MMDLTCRVLIEMLGFGYSTFNKTHLVMLWQITAKQQHTVGSKTVAMFGYFALHAMWSLIAWESLLALAEWIEVFDLGFLLVF